MTLVGLPLSGLRGEVEVRVRGKARDESLFGQGDEPVQSLAPLPARAADDRVPPYDGQLNLPEFPLPATLRGAGGVQEEAFSLTHGPGRLEEGGPAVDTLLHRPHLLDLDVAHEQLERLVVAPAAGQLL
ncbi:MAG: hypothetical protein ACYCX3_01620, partial [Thermoleophilia bacterium]